MEYEICYLIGESKEVDWEKIKKNVEAVIIKNDGTLLDDDFREKRRLAYEIKKEARGTYLAKRFTLPSVDERKSDKNFIAEITAELNLNDDILRFIIVKADELPVELSSKQKDEREKEGVKKEKNEVKREIVIEKKKEEVKKVEKIKKDDKSEKLDNEKKSAKVSTKDEETEKNEKAVSDDDIDEKLDEILNI